MVWMVFAVLVISRGTPLCATSQNILKCSALCRLYSAAFDPVTLLTHKSFSE